MMWGLATPPAQKMYAQTILAAALHQCKYRPGNDSCNIDDARRLTANVFIELSLFKVSLS